MWAHTARADSLDMSQPPGPLTVRIRVRGVLGETVVGAFPDLLTSVEDGSTVLSGDLPDQSALFGVFDAVEELGLEILEVDCDCG